MNKILLLLLLSALSCPLFAQTTLPLVYDGAGEYGIITLHLSLAEAREKGVDFENMEQITVRAEIQGECAADTFDLLSTKLDQENILEIEIVPLGLMVELYEKLREPYTSPFGPDDVRSFGERAKWTLIY